MAYQSSFTYEVEMSYIDPNGTEYSIPSPAVHYIVVDYDYDNRIMPIIYVICNLETNIYLAMQNSQFKGNISFTLSKRNDSGTSKVYKKYIQDQFDYFMKDSPNPTKEMDLKVAGKGQSYRTVVIGMIKSALIKNNNKAFKAGVYRNTNVATLIQQATSHMKVVMEPLLYNTDITEFSIPPISSVGQFVEYVDKNFSLYGSPYCYFLDFDKTYIRSNSGKWIDAKDGMYKYIAIDIRDMTAYRSLIDGIVVDDNQEAYVLYVGKDKSSINTDRVTPNTVGTIVTVGSDGSTQSASIDTSITTNVSADIDDITVIRSDNANLAKTTASAIEENAIQLIVSKAHTDHSIYTLNKEYLLSNYDGNTQYNGRYYLSFKKEVYQRSGNELKGLINLGLRKVK